MANSCVDCQRHMRPANRVFCHPAGSQCTAWLCVPCALALPLHGEPVACPCGRVIYQRPPVPPLQQPQRGNHVRDARIDFCLVLLLILCLTTLILVIVNFVRNHDFEKGMIRFLRETQPLVFAGWCRQRETAPLPLWCRNATHL